jgi:CRP-like cAMP-binding protein
METMDLMILEHPFFRGLNPCYSEILAELATPVKFEAQTYIFKEGTSADQFFLIRQGLVALETHLPGRGEVTVQTVCRGEALGWSWFFPPNCWRFSARTLEATEAIAFDGRTLRERAKSNPVFGYDLAMRAGNVLLQRLNAVRAILVDFHGVTE